MRIENIQSNFQRPNINRSVDRTIDRPQSNEKTSRRNRDILVLDPANKKNKMNSPLENLMERKQQLVERKNELIKGALDSGAPMDTISEQIQAIEEQMKNIDEEISKTMLDTQRKNMGLDEEEKQKEERKIDETPKTKAEGEKEELASFVEFGANMSQIKTLTSVKAKAEGDARILKAEISLDEAHSLSGQTATTKRNQLSKLEDTIEKAGENIADKLLETNDKIATESNKNPKIIEEDSKDVENTAPAEDSEAAAKEEPTQETAE